MTLLPTGKKLLFLFVFLFSISVPAENGEWAKLFKIQLQLAKQGDANAMFKLANMYENGQGTPVDLEKAIRYYKAGVDATIFRSRKETIRAKIPLRGIRIKKKPNQQQATSINTVKNNFTRNQKSRQGTTSGKILTEWKQLHTVPILREKMTTRPKIFRETVADYTVAPSNNNTIDPSNNESKNDWEVVTTELLLPPPIRLSPQQETHQNKKNRIVVRVKIKPDTAAHNQTFKTNPCLAAVSRFTSTCN